MDDYYECYNFFQECRSFVIKHQNFLAACKRIREHNENLDPKMLNSFVDLFADVQEEMEATCKEHKCIINYQTDNESERLHPSNLKYQTHSHNGEHKNIKP